MPLHLDIKSVFQHRCERVKGVDIHPTEPWVLTCLYSGHVHIWNYAEQTLVKSFEIGDLPVRTARFVARKQWVVCGCDDMMVRVYNYNTMDKVRQWEAHNDYIRQVAVHPTLPYLLTCGDDMLIKLWDWERGWVCSQVYEGHTHYVMAVAFNPRDPNTFASASLDRTVKVWSVGSALPNFTLEGHEKGVNAVDYYTGGDRPYLASGADDATVRVWDYQTKACIQVLEGHASNVSAVAFHPELPLLISGAEDGLVKLWHAATYREEECLSAGLERVWAIAAAKGSRAIVVGYDEGVCMTRLGSDDPVASMDAGGRVVWARHADVLTASVRAAGGEDEGDAGAALPPDGERLALAPRDLGASELYPQSLSHSSNGRFVALCGDGEYVVYTALAWRSRAFGPAAEFVWGEDGNTYATREAGRRGAVKIHRAGGKEPALLDADALLGGARLEGMHGGALLALRTADSVAFVDWAGGRLVRRIEAEGAQGVYWSEGGAQVALATKGACYVLAYDRGAAEEALAAGAAGEDGVEEAMELVTEIGGQVRSAAWAGDCFIYVSAQGRLSYAVGGDVSVLAHLERPVKVLGYLALHSRVYLVDRECAVVAYALPLAVVEFKTLALRGDWAGAKAALEGVPEADHDALARFLEARRKPRRALALARDPAYRFELALSLGRLDLAARLAAAAGSQAQWRALAEAALRRGALDVAGRAAEAADDHAARLLLAVSRADRAALADVAARADAGGKANVAFVALLLLGDVDAAGDVLSRSGRLPEAAFFARTYAPSRASETLRAWVRDFAKVNPKAAEALADPDEYPNLFPRWEEALRAEQALRRNEERKLARDWARHEHDAEEDVLEAYGAGGGGYSNGRVAERVAEMRLDDARGAPESDLLAMEDEDVVEEEKKPVVEEKEPIFEEAPEEAAPGPLAAPAPAPPAAAPEPAPEPPAVAQAPAGPAADELDELFVDTGADGEGDAFALTADEEAMLADEDLGDFDDEDGDDEDGDDDDVWTK